MTQIPIYEEEYVRQIIAAARSEDGSAHQRVWILLNEFGQKWRQEGRRELIEQIKALPPRSP